MKKREKRNHTGPHGHDYLKEKKRQAPVAFRFQYHNQVLRQVNCL